MLLKFNQGKRAWFGYFSSSDTCILSGGWLGVDLRMDIKMTLHHYKRLYYALEIP